MFDIKLPKSLKVGGFDYDVRVDEETGKELRAEGLWGHHSGDLRRIRIDPTLADQQFTNTAIHELIHAVDSIFNEGKKLSEVQVFHLANGLHQVFEQLGVRIVKEE